MHRRRTIFFASRIFLAEDGTWRRPEDINCGDKALALPTFVVIGAMKAGTVSLRHYLDEHPDVFLGRGDTMPSATMMLRVIFSVVEGRAERREVGSKPR